MPKLTSHPVQLPTSKPDCCLACPLCGKIPDNMRPKGSREGYVCLGTMEAIGTKAVRILASERDSKHPLHRPCDAAWNGWMTIPTRKIRINSEAYGLYRVPFINALQTTIKFHNNEKQGL